MHYLANVRSLADFASGSLLKELMAIQATGNVIYYSPMSLRGHYMNISISISV